jgi:hypothetical protein
MNLPRLSCKLYLVNGETAVFNDYPSADRSHAVAWVQSIRELKETNPPCKDDQPEVGPCLWRREIPDYGTVWYTLIKHERGPLFGPMYCILYGTRDGVDDQDPAIITEKQNSSAQVVQEFKLRDELYC